jgi:hypothetical protein
MTYESGHMWPGNKNLSEEKAMVERRHHFHSLQATIAIAFVAVGILTFVLIWKAEHDSCVRANNLRYAFNTRGVLDMSQTGYPPGSRVRAPLLDCSGWPDSSRKITVVRP